MEEEKLVAKLEKPKPKTNYWLIGLTVLVIILASVTAWLAYSYAKKSDGYQQINSQLTIVTNELNDLKNSKTQPTTTPTPKPTISPALKENITAAINTMNTAALEGYMTNPVTVVLAASEFGGPRTPTQAVSDLNYLSSATGPWNFNLSTPQLNAYKAGAYSQYFGDNTIVGKSANDYVVSFAINDSGKISVIFIAANASLLI
jgi:hypothetical protein